MSENDWIFENDSSQCEWALNYLQKKKDLSTLVHLAINTDKTPYNIVITALSRIPESLEKKELIRLMKRAWSRRKNAIKHDNKKECTYNIDFLAIKKLHKLANNEGMPLNKTLELLINRGFDFEEEAKRDAKNEREKEKELRNQKANTKKRAPETTELNAVKRELVEAQGSFEELHKKYKAQLQTLCEYMVKLQDADIFDKPMTEDQKKRRDQKTQEKLEKQDL